MSAATWTKAAPLADVPDPGSKVVELGTWRVVLCRAGTTVWAVEDKCTHEDGPLGEGTLEGTEIMCPRHGAKFDVTDGSVTRMPAAFPVRTFKTRIENGEISVELPA